MENNVQKFFISAAMRFFLLFSGSVIWLGIWLTGFAKAHWLLYVPPSLFYFAGITGLCPGLILSRMVFREKI